jgi:hypothetical protein
VQGWQQHVFARGADGGLHTTSPARAFSTRSGAAPRSSRMGIFRGASW